MREPRSTIPRRFRPRAARSPASPLSTPDDPRLSRGKLVRWRQAVTRRSQLGFSRLLVVVRHPARASRLTQHRPRLASPIPPAPRSHLARATHPHADTHHLFAAQVASAGSGTKTLTMPRRKRRGRSRWQRRVRHWRITRMLRVPRRALGGRDLSGLSTLRGRARRVPRAPTRAPGARAFAPIK